MKKAIPIGIIIGLLVVAFYQIVTHDNDFAVGGFSDPFLTIQGGTGTSTAPSDLQLLVGLNSGAYGVRTLTAGTGITLATSTTALTITSSAGTVYLASTTPWTTGDIVEVAGNGTVKSTSTISSSKIQDAYLLNTSDTLTGTLTLSALSSAVLTVDGSGVVTASTSLASSFIDDVFLFNTGDTGTGVYDFGGATSFEIVNGASPTVDATGEVAVDTTSGQLKWFDGNDVHILTGTTSPAFSIASTTQGGDGNSFDSATATILLKNPPEPLTLVGWYCKIDTDVATVTVQFTDGSNATNNGLCTENGGFTSASSNNTFTLFEDLKVQIGTQSGDPDRVTITTVINKTAD